MLANEKFIVWDWNGTLLDDVHVSHQAANSILSKYGRAPITIEAFIESFEMPISKTYTNWGFSEDELARDLIAMQDVFHDYYETNAADASLRKGLEEIAFFSESRSFSNMIVSNHLVPSITAHLARLQISQLIETVIAYESRGKQFRTQTKGERLRSFMEANGLDAKNAIIVGDTPEETHIGREFGIISVAVTGGYASPQRLEAARPDYMIDDLHELKPILKKHGFMQ